MAEEAEPRSRIGTVVTVIIIVIIGVIIWQRRTEMHRLLHRIEVGTPDEQMRAVRRFVEKETLPDAMEEAPRWVQENTVTALERMADHKALEQMIAAKSLLDAPVEARCNRILVRIGRPAIDVLVDSLKDKDAAIRGAAVAPLQQIGEPVVKPVLALADAWDQYVRDAVRDVLAVVGEPAMPELMRIVYQYEPPAGKSAAKHLRRRDTAIRTIEAMRAPAISSLIAGLTRPEPEIRGAIVTMLGHIADQSIAGPLAAAEAVRVIKPLLAALEDPEWTVRRKAAEALGPMFAKTVASPTPDGLNPLIAHLKTPDVPSRVTSTLIKHLDDARAEVKAAAAQSLGLVGDPVAAEPLVRTLMEKPGGAWKELGLALQRIGNQAVPAVSRALGSPNEDVRILATGVLANIGGKETIEPLARALADPNVEVRRLATDALRTSADARAVQYLVRALEDEDWHVYVAARDALVHIGQPAVPALVEVFRKRAATDERVALLAQQALTRIGKPAIPALIEELTSPNAKAREWAAIALGEIGSQARGPLLEVLASSPSAPARAAAADALGRSGSREAVPQLQDAAKDPDPAVRLSVVTALDALRDERGATTLVASLRDSDAQVRQAAMLSLRSWPTKTAGDLLSRMLADPSLEVRCRAAIALMGKGGLIELVARGTSATGVVVGQGTDTLAEAVGKWLAAPDKASLVATTLSAVQQVKDLPGLQASPEVKELWSALEASRRRVTPENLAMADRAARKVNELPALRKHRAVRVLQEAIKDPSLTAELRQYAAIALGISADPAAAPALSGLIADRQYTKIAAVALSRMSDAGVNTLVELLASKDEYVRLWASTALVEIGNPAIRALGDVLRAQDETAAVAAIAALGAIGSPAVGELLIVMGGRNQTASDRAAVALDLIGDPEGLRVLKARNITPDKKMKDAAKAAVQEIRARQIEAADMRL
jgi:HEAT repeat protein